MLIQRLAKRAPDQPILGRKTNTHSPSAAIMIQKLYFFNLW